MQGKKKKLAVKIMCHFVWGEYICHETSEWCRLTPGDDMVT